MKIGFNQNDGGRSKYFNFQAKGDCVTRAIAIANELDYLEIHNKVRKVKNGNPDTGICSSKVVNLVENFGWVYIETHGHRLSEINLPNEDIIVFRNAHLLAIKNGKIQDSFNSIKTKGIKIRGYFRKEITCLFDDNYFEK